MAAHARLPSWNLEGPRRNEVPLPAPRRPPWSAVVLVRAEAAMAEAAMEAATGAEVRAEAASAVVAMVVATEALGTVAAAEAAEVWSRTWLESGLGLGLG